MAAPTMAGATGRRSVPETDARRGTSFPEGPLAMRCVAVVLLLSAVFAAQGQVESDQLRRGLVVTHRDEARTELVRLEPTVALNLKAGDAPHPRLSAGSGSALWEGFINLTRADTYRFRVHLRGAFKLKIGAKDVLNVESKGEKPVVLAGPEVRLE